MLQVPDKQDATIDHSCAAAKHVVKRTRPLQTFLIQNFWVEAKDEMYDV